MTMLHEMVHVENPKWKGHGWKFEHRMLKLAKARAFAGVWELCYNEFTQRSAQ